MRVSLQLQHQNSIPQASANPLQPGLITDFEVWNNWIRGKQTWGTFAQSQEQVHAGHFSGKFVYTFPALPNNYITYQHPSPIAGQPSALQIWVYGDGTGNFLNAWVQDASGQLWQFTFGQIKHKGWQQMIAPLDVNRGWPNQRISGHANSTKLVYPLGFYGLVVDGWNEQVTSKGTIFVDDLFSVNVASTTPTPVSTPSPANASQATTNTPQYKSSVSFRADDFTLDAVINVRYSVGTPSMCKRPI